LSVSEWAWRNIGMSTDEYYAMQHMGPM
jgi:hypothetical protein